MEEIFADLIFYVDIQEARHDEAISLTTWLKTAIGTLGGTVASVYDDACTHLVLRHRGQDLYRAAQLLDQNVVAPGFVMSCLSEQKLVEETEEGVYPACEIPGFKENVQEVTQTDFRGLERQLVRYKCECTGARYSGVMTVPANTTHLVVKDLATASEKVVKARKHPSVHIVSIEWLDECLKEWKFLAEEPYTLEGAQVADSSEEDGGFPSLGGAPAQPNVEAEAEQDEEPEKPDLDPTLAIDDEMLGGDDSDGNPDKEQNVQEPEKDQKGKQENVPATEPGKSLAPPSTEVPTAGNPEPKSGPKGLKDAPVPTFMMESSMQDMDMSQQVAHAGSVIGALASQLDITTQVQEDAKMAEAEPAKEKEREDQMDAADDGDGGAIPPTLVMDEGDKTDEAVAADQDVAEKEHIKSDGDDQEAASLHGANPPMGLSMSLSPPQEKDEGNDAVLERQEATPVEKKQPKTDATKEFPAEKGSEEGDGDNQKPQEGNDPVDPETNAGNNVKDGEINNDVQVANTDEDDVQDMNVEKDVQERNDVDNVQDMSVEKDAQDGNDMECDNGGEDADDVDQSDQGNQPAGQQMNSEDGKDSEPMSQSEPSRPVVRRSARKSNRKADQKTPPRGSARRSARRRASKVQAKTEDESSEDPKPRRSLRARRLPKKDMESEEGKSTEGSNEEAVTRTVQRTRRGRAPARRSTVAKSEPETPAAEGVRTRAKRASRSGQTAARGTPTRGPVKRKGRRSQAEREESSDSDEPQKKMPRRSLRIKTPAKVAPPPEGGSRRKVATSKRKSSLNEPRPTPAKRARNSEAQEPARPAFQRGSQSNERRQRRRRRHSQAEPLFAISGMEKYEKTKITESLAELEVKTASGSYDPKTTHVVVPLLRRNDKTMCGMAAGKWILTSEYVQRCQEEDDLVEETPFELSKTDNDVISEGAPAHWRTRSRKLGVGAFEGIEAFFYGELDAPGNDTVQRIITAGGGKVLKKAPPYTEQLKKGTANIAVIGSDKSRNTDRTTKSFLNSGVTCVTTEYVINWVAHPQEDLGQYRLFDCKGTQELKAMEKARGSVTGSDSTTSDSDTSASF
ncbi:hypothetical protein BSKO_03005 [Bryopsis sp. KO-2023]|nr:hypothetical protein BSKO_03005 [Bryopsis sp. KO-2023]